MKLILGAVGPTAEETPLAFSNLPGVVSSSNDHVAVAPFALDDDVRHSPCPRVHGSVLPSAVALQVWRSIVAPLLVSVMNHGRQAPVRLPVHQPVLVAVATAILLPRVVRRRDNKLVCPILHSGHVTSSRGRNRTRSDAINSRGPTIRRPWNSGQLALGNASSPPTIERKMSENNAGFEDLLGGWGTGIRTPIASTRNSRPAVRRFPNDVFTTYFVGPGRIGLPSTG
jgi:hypothetical protein